MEHAVLDDATAALSQPREPQPSHTPFGIAVIGLGPVGWHVCERVSLRDDAFLAAVWDVDPRRQQVAAEQGWPASAALADLWQASRVEGVIIDAPLTSRAPLVRQALAAGKHVLAEPPLAEHPTTAADLYATAAQQGVSLWCRSLRRWDEDFAAAISAFRSGRLGLLHTVRFLQAEWAPWAGMDEPDPADAAGETFARLVPPVLDQLSEFVELNPIDVWVRRLPISDGFVLELTLGHQTVVQIDLRRRALAALHTGWILEGHQGGYRGGRLFTLTPEGELIDEPVRTEPLPTDPWLAQWLRHCRSSLPPAEALRGRQLVALFQRLREALALVPGGDMSLGAPSASGQNRLQSPGPDGLCPVAAEP